MRSRVGKPGRRRAKAANAPGAEPVPARPRNPGATSLFVLSPGAAVRIAAALSAAELSVPAKPVEDRPGRNDPRRLRGPQAVLAMPVQPGRRHRAPAAGRRRSVCGPRPRATWAPTPCPCHRVLPAGYDRWRQTRRGPFPLAPPPRVLPSQVARHRGAQARCIWRYSF